jgi:maleylacetoacetate isomerase/maleylpyruvate isomerase
LHPALSEFADLQFLEKDFGFTAAQKDHWLQEWLGRNLESSEKILQSTAGTFCFGSQVTAAEAFLMPQLFTAQRFNIDISKYPIIIGIKKRCEEMEVFQKAHPFNQPDTPAEMKK